MDKGIYAAASGGLFTKLKLDVVANNLANVNTVGFKAARLIGREQTFEETLASSLPAGRLPGDPQNQFKTTPGVVSVATATDFTPGPLQQTGNPFDVALRDGDEFFVVQTPEGDAYTRAGNFTLDANSNLVTQDGHPVLGDGGQITLPQGNARITSSGAILVNDEPIGRLRVVKIDRLDQLTRQEGVRFKLEGEARPKAIDNPTVVPGSLEMPNVAIVEAMVDMISSHRGFEAYQKMARTIDELNDRAIRNARINS